MKKLIAYFSWSGNTRKLVKEINKRFNYDVVEIERKVPYSSDYNQCAYVEAKEEVSENLHPEIKELSINPNDYDEILLFFPIWWYTFPMPIGTFIESLKGYNGKVVLFMNSYTNDPQYVENSIRDFKKINSSIKVERGLFNKSLEEHLEFIKGE